MDLGGIADAPSISYDPQSRIATLLRRLMAATGSTWARCTSLFLKSVLESS
jgi:hypothetical protein